MARVLALVPDLLFGSRVQGSLLGAGHEVELIGEQARLSDRLRDGAGPAVAVLVVDLTSEDLDGAGLVRALSGAGELAGIRTLGFYSHVDTDTRERAEQAGFDMVVPRSRMAREGADLVTRLAAGEGVSGVAETGD
jgi:DNA-binding NarL/FixJ family response regulator